MYLTQIISSPDKTNNILPSKFLLSTPNPMESVNMPSSVSIKVAQAHNELTWTMHIPLTFLLIIKRLFFFQTSSTLWIIPTNQPQHILFKNNNIHHSNTYPSHFYHLFTQLLLHHNSHTTNSISFSRLPQLTSFSFDPQHPSTLHSPSHLLWATHINHPLSRFSVNFSQLFTQTTKIPRPNPHPNAPIRPPDILQAKLSRSRMLGCNFHFMAGRCRQPKHSG